MSYGAAAMGEKPVAAASTFQYLTVDGPHMRALNGKQ